MNIINTLIMIILIPFAFSFTMFVATVLSVTVECSVAPFINRFKSNRFNAKEN